MSSGTSSTLGDRLARLETRLQHIETAIGRIEKALTGDSGRHGLITDVDRLKQSEKLRLWFMGGISMAVIGVIAQNVLSFWSR